MRQASREAGAALAARLRERRAEIEEAMLIRVTSLSAVSPAGDSEYAVGLRRAVEAALDHGLAAVERGDERALPVPEVLLSQARLAARSGVSLDTVLRRYLAGHALLDDFLIEEADRFDRIGPNVLKRLLRTQAAIVDRLLAAVAKAYTEEAESRPKGLVRQRAERIERLLDGEPLDTTSLGYEFGTHHIALLAHGSGAAQVIRSLGTLNGSQVLSVPREDEVHWAWLGSRRPQDPGELCRWAKLHAPSEVRLALGEPGQGMTGWRLSHRQARAALSIALRRGEQAIRYADVALLAAAMTDELLASSLQRLYLEPLDALPDGGEVPRETLSAYFAAGQNTSSAAAALGVNRGTVTKRLRVIEASLGRSLSACSAELTVSLGLARLSQQVAGSSADSPSHW